MIDLPVFSDARGTLAVVEGNNQIDFDIARIFYMYDVADTSERGGHTLRSTHQVLIATSGSVTVYVDDGVVNDTIRLEHPHQALHIPPGVWRSMRDFSADSVLLVLASEPYDPADYIRDYAEYLAYKGPG